MGWSDASNRDSFSNNSNISYINISKRKISDKAKGELLPLQEILSVTILIFYIKVMFNCSKWNENPVGVRYLHCLRHEVRPLVKTSKCLRCFFDAVFPAKKNGFYILLLAYPKSKRNSKITSVLCRNTQLLLADFLCKMLILAAHYFTF